MNTRIASSRSSASAEPLRSAAISASSAPRAVSRAVCMATQRWQPFLVAMVMMTTSRAIGSSVVPSNAALIFRKPSSSSGEVAISATPAGR